MKRIACFLILFAMSTTLGLAQKKAAPVKKTTTKTVTKPAASTEDDLKKAYKKGDYARAIAIADEMLKQKPNDQMLLVVKTMSYAMLGNKEMAKKTADVLYPTSKDTEAIFLATLPINLAADIVEKDAGWYIGEAHKMSPGSPVVYLIEASIYADDSLFDKSRATAQAGAAYLSDKHPAQVKAQFANLLFVSGAKDEGYKLVNQVLAADPLDSNSQTVYYSMLLKDKKYTEAQATLDKLVKQFPDNMRLRKERAFLFEEMGKHGDACSEAIKLADEDANYLNLAIKIGCPQAFVNLTPTAVKAYTYDVDYHGMKYQFIVRPKKVKMDEGVSFDWNMTVNDKMQGTVNISKAALDTASGQMNTFSAGNSDLTNLTTVWVSNNVYRDLKKFGEATLTASENGPKRFAVVEDEDKITIRDAAGKTRALNTLHIRSEDDSEELWINDDAANPMITHMSIGWSIELAGVE